MFTKEIYKTVLKGKIKLIDKRLTQIIQSPTIPKISHSLLTESIAQGRRFRPLLLLITNAGVGGNWKDVIDLACAIELLHKASLIHDDLIDKDILRRGQATFWKTHGDRQAIIMGDVLIGLSFNTASQWCKINNHQNTIDILDTLTKTLTETAIGELLDVQLESAPTSDFKIIENMTALKSASLIAASMRIGALSGNAPSDLTETLIKLGWQIGTIFQMINDMNNITGRDIQSKGTLGIDLIQKKENVVTATLHQAGIQFEELPTISEKQLTEILEPVSADIDYRIAESLKYVAELPDNFMKKLFGKLLKEAKEDWFWIDLND